MSDDKWNFKTITSFSDDFDFDTAIYIENISQKKFLERKYDDNVVLKDFNEDEKDQIWYKGQPNAEGYFILENRDMRAADPRIMTATSSSDMKIKGNIPHCYFRIF